MTNNGQQQSQPSYNELKACLEAEKRIKNHLYYYLSFQGLIPSYQAYLQVYANEANKLEEKDAETFRIITLTNSLYEVLTTGRKKNIEIEYTLNPN